MIVTCGVICVILVLLSLRADTIERAGRRASLEDRESLSLSELRVEFNVQEANAAQFAAAISVIGKMLHVDSGRLRPADRVASFRKPSWIGSLGESDLDDLMWEISAACTDSRTTGSDRSPMVVDTVSDAVDLLMDAKSLEVLDSKATRQAR
jgi:hypothetical protein